MSVTVTHDDLWLCPTCAIAAVNGDFSGIDNEPNEERREAEYKAVCDGLDALGKLGNLVPDYDSETGEGTNEFSSLRCDCCDGLPGSRTRFAILGEAP